jgi:hypothetical protein
MRIIQQSFIGKSNSIQLHPMECNHHFRLQRMVMTGTIMILPILGIYTRYFRNTEQLSWELCAQMFSWKMWLYSFRSKQQMEKLVSPADSGYHQEEEK